jgi:PAS domain S-box-containing protein
MKSDLTIREKLMLYFILLGVVAILTVSVYSFLSARKAILERSFLQLTSIREVKKARVEGFFSDRLREVDFLTYSLGFSSQTCSGKSIQVHIDSVTHSFLLSADYYSSLTIVCNPDSYVHIPITLDTVLVHEPIPDLDSLFAKMQHIKTPHFFDYVYWNKTYIIRLASPVLSPQGSLDALLLFGIPVSAINQIMVEDSTFGGMGHSGESYLVGKDLLMRSSSRFQEHSVMQTLVNTEGVNSSFSGDFGTKIIADYRGIRVLSSHSIVKLQDFEWAILSEIDFKEVMTPVYGIRNDIIVISGFIIILLCIVAFAISRRITEPLITLRSLALDIAQGTYGKTIPIDTNDEVGELSEAFNTMSLKISEKTKELREREKRLNHFYKATTDGIIFHNRGELVLVNQAVYEMTVYTEAELTHLRLHDIIVIPDVERYLSHPNQSFVFETECITKFGERFPIEVIENPIEYDGNIISASVIRNITERKESQRKLQTERTKRINSFLDGQENERSRLSRELHDGIGQSLVGIKMRVDMLKLQDDDKNNKTLLLIKNFVNQTIQDVRRVSNNLLPSILHDIGLKLAIEKLCRETQENSSITITFDAETFTKVNSDKVKTYLYRITQEAIQNAIKHSKATEMSIMLLQEPTKARLIIEDNGVGFDIENLTERGNGLYYMQERASILGGNITISSGEGRGTYIDVRIPL